MSSKNKVLKTYGEIISRKDNSNVKVTKVFESINKNRKDNKLTEWVLG